ncbi:hypothetical protein A2954_00760 [Candidatus Roizmanbacteria bacterium RIFCSPLOWO2_01_FULL_37_12]|uniref:Resolvase/invertase-type recombinase catalytic domain-containing protein n=1 Tax=Candidatus Roizmanbacteria bacterium RIFCSPLOWO2_01_FULL_37_12 TaxID=1802056 RepID=A0A1F7IDT5_9BACT|nr:MAG: hypothetical protein A2954_00760 [Candidatus Roizmanbacteria bacterium RIFCSPLOWO2_01_FULL_37_12]
MKKTCYIYARTANALQKEAKRGASSSINKQINDCSKYAKKKNFKILGIFKDIGKGGHSLRRKELINLFALSRVKPATAVIISDTSRISRNFTNTVNILSRLSRHGIKLISLKEGVLSMDAYLINVLNPKILDTERGRSN